MEEKEEEKQKPKVRFVALSKEGRGANCSAMRETHEIVYGIDVEGYLPKTEKRLIENSEPGGDWVNMTNCTCKIWFANGREYGWKPIPISQIAHRVESSLDDFTDYRVAFDPSKGLVISTLEVFPYEEERVKEWNIYGGHMSQVHPGRTTYDKWKHSHAHNMWFRVTESKELDQFVETLLLEDFKKSGSIYSRPEEHELWNDSVQFSKAISELLKDISIYNRMKYNFHNKNVSLETLFW